MIIGFTRKKLKRLQVGKPGDYVGGFAIEEMKIQVTLTCKSVRFIF